MKSEVNLVSWSRWKLLDSSSPRLRLQGVPEESATQTQGCHHRGGAESDGRRAPWVDVWVRQAPQGLELPRAQIPVALPSMLCLAEEVFC